MVLPQTRMVKSLGWAALAVGVLASNGCIGTTMGALLAPQMVAGQAVAGVAQAASRSLTSELGQLASTEQTVADIDRILKENPDAENRAELEELRNSLMREEPLGSDPRRRRAAFGPAQDEYDRRAADAPAVASTMMPTGDGLRMWAPHHKGHRLVIDPPPAAGDPGEGTARAELRPFANARTSSLDSGQTRFYTLSTQPVRLSAGTVNR